MLNKWQQTAVILITKEDFDATVVFAKDANSITNSSEKRKVENIMKKYIMNNIKDFIDKTELCTVSLYAAKGGMYDIFKEEFYGNIFINFYWEQICNSDGIRMKITKYNGQQLTFILIKQ